MQISGIICEYNPLHLGHKKQIDYLKEQDHAVVCLMSGNYVQRGHPAIFDKMIRTEAAIRCGADLVLELPINYALSSAEGFATGGVEILSKLCHNICFGAESADIHKLLQIAEMLQSPIFSEKLRFHLNTGVSFPTARSAALLDCGLNAEILATPNNILAVEYCKAILLQNARLNPIAISRKGDYHNVKPDADNPSATALRNMINSGQSWFPYVPEDAYQIFSNASVHDIKMAEKAIIYRLRTMTDSEFEALPFGSEGLWRKLMHASRNCTDLESIINSTKSKRYTRTRIDRMILCAFLGLTEVFRQQKAPYVRVLGFNDTGRKILNAVKDTEYFVNIGERTQHLHEQMEHQSGSLYGLFANTATEPQLESNYRIYYQKKSNNNS